jgi:hypothetical protein
VAKTVEYHNPDFEDGLIFDVGGLAIPNGGSIELDEDAELLFFSKKQQSVSDFFAGEKLVKVSGKSELSKAVMDVHTGTSINSEPPSLDAAVVASAEVPEDDDGVQPTTAKELADQSKEETE